MAYELFPIKSVCIRIGVNIMSEIAVFLGKRIKSLRKEAGMSQEELAYRASISPAHLGQIERALKNPTLDTINSIAQALGISLSQLFEETGDFVPRAVSPYENKLNAYLSGMSDRQRKDILKMIKLVRNFKHE